MDAIGAVLENAPKFYFADSSEGSSSGESEEERKQKLEESDDSPLHSLESEAHGVTIQRYISKYMDHGFDESLIRETKKRKEKENFGRQTLKAATQQTLSQRIFPNKEHSRSAGNLMSLSSPASPKSGSLCSSPTCHGSNSPPIFFPLTEKIPDSVEKLEVRRKKQWHKKRSLERDMKNESGSFESATPSPNEIEKDFAQENNPVLKLAIAPNRTRAGHRSPSTHGTECPFERIQFYKTFSLLIRMGNKEKQSIPENEYKVMDNEEQLSLQAVKDYLWLELKAWHASCMPCEQKRNICIQRQSISDFLNEILTFTILDTSKNDSGYSSSCCGNTFTFPSLHENRTVSNKLLFLNEEQVDGNKVAIVDSAVLKYTTKSRSESQSEGISSGNDKETKTIQSLVESLEKGHKDISPLECSSDKLDCSIQQKNGITSTNGNISFPTDFCNCNETLSRLCQNCINKETEALIQVTKVLDKLDEIEHLYPCSKALGSDYPIYNSDDFISRIKTLNLWLNLTRELRRKINSLAKLFGLREKLKVGWPCYEPVEMQNLPLQQGKQTRDETNKSNCSLKIVHFPNLTEITSSPSTSGSDRGCCSVPVSPDIQSTNPFDTSGSSNSSQQGLSPSPGYLDGVKYHNGTHIYRRYVDKTLRHKGLKYIYSQLSSVLRSILFRVHAALKRPKPTTYAAAVAKVVTDSPSPTAKYTDTFLPCPNKVCCEELATYGVWSETFQKMGLPTFHRPFLFLLRVPLDVVHECLQLRIQQQPEEPSLLSIGQLIKECKEVLRAGIQMRQRYINLAQTVFGEDGTDVIEAQLDIFDGDLKTMLQIYLRYLEKRKVMAQEFSPFTVHQKNSLEEEWAFVRATCPHIPGGEALVAKKFCFLASDLLLCIGNHVDRGIKEFVSALDTNISLNQVNSSVHKKEVLHACRMFKRVFNDASDKARQAVCFAKTLRKDLEIAAEFKILVPSSALLQKLKDTGHIRVIAPQSSNHMMFVPGHLQYNETYIWQLVDMTCGHESIDPSMDQDVYLVMMRYQASDNAQSTWKGPTILLEPTAEAIITLSQIEVDGLLLVVNHSSQLMSQCWKFQKVMSNTLQIEKQQTSCNYAIAEALGDLKDEALCLCESITQIMQKVEKHLDMDALTGLDEADRNNILGSYREVLHQGYKFGFEYLKGVARLITGESRTKMGKVLISFAHQWMRFVSAKYERGRGHRPRWANQGLEFLIAACDPQYLQILTDDEFQELKQCMNNCITHLIGSPLSGSRVTSPTHSSTPPNPVLWCCPKQLSNDSQTPSSPPINYLEGPSKSIEYDPSDITETSSDLIEISGSRLYRTRLAVFKLEQKLHDKLESKKTIGRVSDIVQQVPPLHISARRVTFPWQRGFKIGEGRFGKVYTAVNNLTGELIAMKEIRLQPNDHRVIKEAMDEIRTFEGIKHPNIVRYYGVEIHREEMLIFMEYCNEGSLESAAQLHLPETLVRKYTRKLLEAVNVLHEHGIVHRDIKSANVFLTSDGNLKLGDFGCCIKLKNHTTMPGELCSFVGTPAYMAPEIFTKNITEGHGRAVDIWSVGCVVLEMATGRKPWYDLDNSYQIMFRVGMGGIPNIPETLSDEGQDFLNHCLQHDPRERWTASMLLDHPFTKVIEDDDVI